MARQGPEEQDGPKTASDGFATTDAEAAARYERWKAEDPFDDIHPALLNSGDIADYVAATGMIFPFQPEPKEDKLKPASYEVNLLGRCVTFTGDKHEDIVVSDVGPGQEYVLRKNEIAFVQVEPYFRLPQYIALRFNLRINNVYRGLLLGTGPLVDPGFVGPLWIPLHNLTSNDYTFVGGEGLVWMEFTKVSPLLSGSERGKRQKYFTEFPEAKRRRNDIEEYLLHADRYRSIRSAIPVLFDQARDDARRAAADADAAGRSAQAVETRARRLATIFSLAATVGLLSIVLASWSLWRSVDDRADEAVKRSQQIETRLERVEDVLDVLQRRGSRKP
jgi:deoxycytidine triphosphate deaminase